MASEQANTSLASATYLIRNSSNCTWEKFESPQFIDFSTLSIIGRPSFYGKNPVVVSTPLGETTFSSVSEENPLIESFAKLRLSGIYHVNEINNNIKNVESNVIKATRKQNTPEKQPKENVGVSRRRVARAKTLPLLTSIWALQRKNFGDAIRQREKQKEQQRRMEQAAKKKQEEEQMKQLRKQLVHKAQPVRKYKLGLPKIQKRPSTHPVTPIVLKRHKR